MIKPANTGIIFTIKAIGLSETDIAIVTTTMAIPTSAMMYPDTITANIQCNCLFSVFIFFCPGYALRLTPRSVGPWPAWRGARTER